MVNKVNTRLRIRYGIVGIFFKMVALSCLAQEKPVVVSDWKVYDSQVKSDSSKKMIELHALMPDLLYDLRYASTNNFMHRLMYPANTKTTFLRRPAAQALANVQTALLAKGMGLKIFDAYRPYSVTVLFWELVHDERYVANPAKGSGHNKGIAVDLTIIDLASGQELNMGTGFDNFTDTAHQTFTGLPAQVLANRALLKGLMEKNGFKALETEWWHFYLAEGARFEVLDIDFKKLKKR